MKGNYPEAEKLIDCLKAVINQQKLPSNDVGLNWELFYKTADFHQISNMVYYAALGIHPSLPREWTRQFAGRYRKAVILEEQYRNLVEAILWDCEQNGLHIMALENAIYPAFYPMPEMRLTDRAEFWVEGRQRDKVDLMMYRLDFIPEDNPQPGVYLYTRAGLRIVFYEKLQFGNRRLSHGYRMPVKSLPKAEGKYYVHKMEEPGLFIFLMCSKAQRFTDREFDLRDMVDIWLYYRAVVRGDSWKYIIKRLSRLGVWNFTSKILMLTDFWFGGGGVGEETEFYEELEKYIFFKGTQGVETAMRILPLLKQKIRRKKKVQKREKRKKIQRWIFPAQEYMLLLYPRMGKYRILLPLCWLRRLVRSFFICLKTKLGNKRKTEKIS